MKTIVCEMCNSNDIQKQDGLYVCQCCGTKYSVEEARKLLVEGTVKNDNSEEIQNLYKLARKARDESNYENAQKYYDMVLLKDSSSWEANFYSVYFQALNCKIAEIGKAASYLKQSIESVLDLVDNSVNDSQEHNQIVVEIGTRLIKIANILSSSATQHYENIDISIRDKYTTEYRDRIRDTRFMIEAYGDIVIERYGDDYGNIASSCWKLGVNLHILQGKIFGSSKSDIESFIEDKVSNIKRFEPNYQAPEIPAGGCYVATAVYGSYDCPEVWTLRRFRDYTLAETWYGRAFIYTYYAISPILVKWFGKTKWFTNLWKPTLDLLVEKLNTNGVEDTPYNDRQW